MSRSHAMKIVDAKTKNILFTQATWASTAWQRVKGLLGKRNLPDGQALLFRNAPCIHTFFMRFAIDIVFLDSRGNVIRLAPSVPPGRIICCWKARCTVETAAGACERKAIHEGHTLEFSESAAD